jgi:3-hydroxy-9,10-secoandrosta-1,3,5(10)-triene-9,17-dione monooxygenase reductase component
MERGPVDQDTFKAVMGSFATGVTIVTATEDDLPVGFTCQSFVSLSLEPPLVALAPARTSTSWPRIRNAGAFCVNVLAEDQSDVCLAFARSGADKFSGLDWTFGPAGTPRLASCLAWVDCDLEIAHDAGDHELVIGRVVDLQVGHGRPLLFYRSAFAHLAET